MKKLALSLALMLNLHIKAEEIETNTPQEATPAEFRIANFKSQAPILAGYFLGSLGHGLIAGTIVNVARSPFGATDALDKAVYIGTLGNLLWQNTDKDQEEIRCAELAQNCNENILRTCRQFVESQIGTENEDATAFYTYELYKRMETFQPEQFEVHNRGYSAAATVLGFTAGAYLGSKIGTCMYDYGAQAWLHFYPAPIINDNHIVLEQTIPKQ